MDEADKGTAGFREILAALLEKLGDDVDQWETPTVLMEERTAERPICLETLWTSTPTAFVTYAMQSGREGPAHVICAHFFCWDCASQQYAKQTSQRTNEYFCPICRAPAKEVLPLPDITREPHLWFEFLDVQRKRQIDKNTVIQTLEAMLPIDTESLRDVMDEVVWAHWDKTGSGHISEDDFFAKDGLLEWVRGHQHELHSAQARGPAPPLDDAEKWFEHWDLAKRGRLGRGEVLRALCEAAQVSSLESGRVKRLKQGIDVVWAQHSSNNTLRREIFLRDEVANALGKLIEDV